MEPKTMINSVNLTGRLTRDPELRKTQSDIAITNITLAVNRTFSDANGERQADFINCVLFRKTAEIAQQYLRKGNLVGVTGRLQSRSYENKDGQRVFVTEVVVENLAFLESKQQSQDSNLQAQQYNQPQVRNGQQENPFASGSVEITDADLPF